MFYFIFTFLVPAYPGSPGKRAVKRVCVCVCFILKICYSCVDVDSFCKGFLLAHSEHARLFYILFVYQSVTNKLIVLVHMIFLH